MFGCDVVSRDLEGVQVSEILVIEVCKHRLSSKINTRMSLWYTRKKPKYHVFQKHGKREENQFSTDAVPRETTMLS